MTFPLRTPVIFLTFNRPELTKQVFTRIRSVKPERLFLVADGPRPEIEKDNESCAQVRRIISNIDWKCEVSQDFASSNMGARRRVVSGLNNAFAQVEKAIILEDDCLPDIGFFRFCEEMLQRYQKEKRIMAISGNHFLPSEFEIQDSYYFLRVPLIWGWATWKRAWQHYPNDITQACKEVQNEAKTKAYFLHRREYAFYKHKLHRIYHQDQDAWDYLWSFAVKKNKGLCICPSANLVTNIGFGKDATNTHENMAHFKRPSTKLGFPLQHPAYLSEKFEYDQYIFQHNIYVPRWQQIKDVVAKYIFYRFFKSKLKQLLYFISYLH